LVMSRCTFSVPGALKDQMALSPVACCVNPDVNRRKSPYLQDTRLERWLAELVGALVVKSVDADVFGGASISLDQDFVLRIFPAGTRGEDWRMFRPNSGLPHLVISGGSVESDDDAERNITNG
jgi:hypothetical protein